MNETRDLIIGIDFGKKYSQICYYDRKAEEARSLPVKVGSSLYETPTCLCRRTDTDQEEYCIGLEAEYFAREKGGFLLEDLYAVSMSREKVHVAGEDREPWEILGLFLRGMLKFPGITISIPEPIYEELQNAAKQLSGWEMNSSTLQSPVMTEIGRAHV